MITFITNVLVFILSVKAQHSSSYTSSSELLSRNLSTNQNDIVTNKLHIGPDGPLFRVPNAVVDVPIPINIPFYQGNDQYMNYCNRDEVVVGYGNKCQKLLQRGNCKLDEEVVIDLRTRMGVCVPRLCPPDRVFVVATQLCHDPRDTSVCPGKRELKYTAFGTAICVCPDGTIESSKSISMYGDVCKSIFGDNNTCPNGQIFWSVDFKGEPQCLPDPCLKFNMYRKPNTLPYVPDQKAGHCHQLGATVGVCPVGTIYALHLPDLKGVCETYENLGFDVFSPEEVATLKNLYGPTSVRDDIFSSSVGYNVQSPTATGYDVQIAPVRDPAQLTPYGNYGPNPTLNYIPQATSSSRNSISTQSMSYFMKSLENGLIHSLGIQYQAATGILESKDTEVLSNNEVNQIYPNSREHRSVDKEANPYLQTEYQILRLPKEGTNLNIADDLVTTSGETNYNYRRLKRQVTFLFAASSNIFETKLLSCSAGARRDFNSKCQETILPIRTARSLGDKPLPPIPPRPMCPMGQNYNVKRMCSSDASFLSKTVIGGLG